MPRSITTAELPALLAPFVRAKLDLKRDPASKFGGYLPRLTQIDIRAICFSIDADIRAVTGEGFEYFFCNGCEFVAWDAVQEVTIRSVDREGRTTGSTVYRVREALRVAA